MGCVTNLPLLLCKLNDLPEFHLIWGFTNKSKSFFSITLDSVYVKFKKLDF